MLQLTLVAQEADRVLDAAYRVWSDKGGRGDCPSKPAYLAALAAKDAAWRKVYAQQDAVDSRALYGDW